MLFLLRWRDFYHSHTPQFLIARLGVGVTLSIFSIISAADTHAYYWAKKSAELEAERGSFPNAVSHYSIAFNTKPGSYIDYYNAACAAALAADPDMAFSWLDHAIALDFLNLEQLVADEDLLGLHGDQRWEKVLSNIKTRKLAFESRVNKPLQTSLETIYENDQRVRRDLNENARSFGRSSEQFKASLVRVGEADQQNLALVTEILDRHGWLSRKLVGPKANSALFLVIQHSPLETQKKYQPLLKLAVSAGAADKRELAMLDDRIAVAEGRPQRYGTQIHIGADGTASVPAVESPELLDERRDEVDLPPMSEYLKNWALSWPMSK